MKTVIFIYPYNPGYNYTDQITRSELESLKRQYVTLTDGPFTTVYIYEQLNVVICQSAGSLPAFYGTDNTQATKRKEGKAMENKVMIDSELLENIKCILSEYVNVADRTGLLESPDYVFELIQEINSILGQEKKL